ncbi:MAG: hypothetical protein ACUVSH_05930 [Anaerolineae bacterium]
MNAERRVQGWLDPPMDTIGQRQVSGRGEFGNR